MRSEELDLRCKIHRFEDKLLMSKDYQDQLSLQAILRKLRIELQNLQWEKQKVGA